MSTPLLWVLRVLWCGWLQRMVVSQLSFFALLWQLGEQRHFFLIVFFLISKRLY